MSYFNIIIILTIIGLIIYISRLIGIYTGRTQGSELVLNTLISKEIISYIPKNDMFGTIVKYDPNLQKTKIKLKRLIS